MGKAVEFNFSHELVFAYLSLLYRMTGKDRLNALDKNPEHEFLFFLSHSTS